MVETRRKGIALIPPSGHVRSWRYRYRDPDSKKIIQKIIPPSHQGTAALRTEYCRRLWVKYVQRRQEIRDGGSTRQRIPLPQLVERYLGVANLKPNTLTRYRKTLTDLVGWLANHGIRSSEHLRPGALREWALWVEKQPRQVPVKGQPAGTHKPSQALRAKTSVTRILVTASTWLNESRRLGLIQLTKDEILDSLKPPKVKHLRRPHLTLDQTRELVTAAVKHDKGLDTRTNAAPVVMFLLTTGMRISEALNILGGDVDLDRGVIHVRPEIAKGGHARAVDLDPSIWLRLRAIEWVKEPAKKILDGWTVSAVKQMLRSGLPKWGAPVTSSHMIRRTSGTITACAPGIYGGSGFYQTARRLGHNPSVSEKYYLGMMKPRHDARTIEDAIELPGMKTLREAT